MFLFSDMPPPNVLVINTEQDAENFIGFIEKINILSLEENILFYGLDLNALCAMQALLGIGVNPKRIHVFCEKDVSLSFNLIFNHQIKF
jgi:hypothetical protein